MELFFENTSLISEKEILQTAKGLMPYYEYLRSVSESGDYDFPESSINLAFDEDQLKNAIRLQKEKTTGDLKYILVVGIGGSNLGAKSVYDALYGYFDVMEAARFPKMIFADTNDPEFLNSLTQFLKTGISKPEEIIVNAISKSGLTTETTVNLEIITDILKEKFEGALSRIVVTTDSKSALWKGAQEKDISILEIPKNVGGRYSVLSTVGLFPLLLCGVDTEGLINGARKMRTRCLSDDFMKNPAVMSAAILFYHFKRGKNICDNFFFHPEMESLGKWYRQLMGESIGKEKDDAGNIINTGITPTVSVGSVDLHSVAQLYLGGPKDKFTTFIWGYTDGDEKIVPKKGSFSELLALGAGGKKPSYIMKAIYDGVKIAYGKAGLPFMEIAFEGINAFSLGEFFQFKMMEMMFLGKLMKINAFNQPNVESYKIETGKILGNS